MIEIKKLWDSMPRDVQQKISLHDLKRTVDNYNAKRPTGMLGKILCRCGKHKLATLRLDHNTLNGGRPSGALYECERCGEVQEWVAAWDQACCIGKWPTLRSFLDSQNVKEHAPPLAGASVETGGEG